MLVIAFMGIFLLIMGTITGYAFEQSKYGRALYGREQALGIAEAGLEYYRWFLAHNPGNLTNGTGLPGPYTYTVNDPEGGTLGSAAISVTGNSQCGVIQSIDLTSKGTSNLNPGFPRTIAVRYMQPSVAQYSVLSQSNVWYGQGENLSGPALSNNGFHMDGTSNSTVSSALPSWYCDRYAGCDGLSGRPTSQNEPGVFGTGSDSHLWSYPVSTVDFPGMTTNLNTLEGYAQSSGIYLSGTANYVNGVQQGSSYPPVGGTSSKGYHLVLNDDGSMDVYRVTSVSGVLGYRPDGSGWNTDYDIISSQTYMNTFTPSSNCAVVYVQGTTWLEGVVSGKYTIVAADPGAFNPDVILSNNLSYKTYDGTSGLAVIAEHSVRVPINSPDTMSIRGIFVASNGYFARDYYDSSVGSTYLSYIHRTQVTVGGTVVSSQQSTLNWCGGTCPPYDSGYNTTIYNFDQVLAFQPPPFTPIASTDYGFVLWREQ